METDDLRFAISPVGILRRRGSFLPILLLAVGSAALPARAQRPSIDVEESACLPAAGNASIVAEVGGMTADLRVHLYFRRLNPLGAFYYNRMFAAGEGRYWSVFPKPELREQPQLTDEWWQELQYRDWMEGRDRAWLEDWLLKQRFEAAEYYVAVVGWDGQTVARSRIRLVGVSDPEGCPSDLGPRERGWARNLTVGETTVLQFGEPVFHWLCDGIVTRIGADGTERGDDFCRACVVAAGGRMWQVPSRAESEACRG